LLCEGGWAPPYAIAVLIGRYARRRLPWGAPRSASEPVQSEPAVAARWVVAAEMFYGGSRSDFRHPGVAQAVEDALALRR